MTWAELHRQSELLASQAEAALRAGDASGAEQLYADAADWEARALGSVAPEKLRTLGITAVSAVALWFKAKRFGLAEGLAYRSLARPELPQFAKTQLKELLHAIRQDNYWTAETPLPDRRESVRSTSLVFSTSESVNLIFPRAA